MKPDCRRIRKAIRNALKFDRTERQLGRQDWHSIAGWINGDFEAPKWLEDIILQEDTNE